MKEKKEITIGRRSAGYALSLWRSNVSDAELTGYILNTKKDVDSEMVVCLVHWLRSIVKSLPDRTLSAWASPGSPRKPFFNWFYQTKKQEAFRDFAFEWLKKQEAELAAVAASSSYGDGVDYGAYPDLADYDTAQVVNDFEAWVAAGGCIPAGDETRGAGLAPDAPPPGVYAMEEAPF